jgi:hypothetical protein
MQMKMSSIPASQPVVNVGFVDPRNCTTLRNFGGKVIVVGSGNWDVQLIDGNWKISIDSRNGANCIVDPVSKFIALKPTLNFGCDYEEIFNVTGLDEPPHLFRPPGHWPRLAKSSAVVDSVK